MLLHNVVSYLIRGYPAQDCSKQIQKHVDVCLQTCNNAPDTCMYVNEIPLALKDLLRVDFSLIQGYASIICMHAWTVK